MVLGGFWMKKQTLEVGSKIYTQAGIELRHLPSITSKQTGTMQFSYVSFPYDHLRCISVCPKK